MLVTDARYPEIFPYAVLYVMPLLTNIIYVIGKHVIFLNSAEAHWVQFNVIVNISLAFKMFK